MTLLPSQEPAHHKCVEDSKGKRSVGLRRIVGERADDAVKGLHYRHGDFKWLVRIVWTLNVPFGPSFSWNVSFWTSIAASVFLVGLWCLTGTPIRAKAMASLGVVLSWLTIAHCVVQRIPLIVYAMGAELPSFKPQRSGVDYCY